MSILLHVLLNILKLIHPIIPFASEMIWQSLAQTQGFLMVADFPVAENKTKTEQAEQAEQLIQFVNAIRNLRGENDFKPNEKINIMFSSKNQQFISNIDEYSPVLKAIAKIHQIENRQKININSDSIAHSSSLFVCSIEASTNKTIDKEKLVHQRQKLEKAMQKIKNKIG